MGLTVSGVPCGSGGRERGTAGVQYRRAGGRGRGPLPAPGTGRGGRQKPRPVRPNGTEKKDEIFGYLYGWGMVKGRAADGVGWDVICPWIDEHTGREDTGTAYWPASGGFKCHHGHCETRNWRDLRQYCEDRVQEESGGLVHIVAWDFDVVPARDRIGTWTGGTEAGTSRTCLGQR